MVRTRRSLAADTGALGESTLLACFNSMETDTRLHLAEAAASASSGNTAPPAKRTRGRPSKASLVAAVASGDSVSSAAPSNCSSNESVSGYSTPLTSHVATPAPEKSQGAAGPSTRSKKLEVVIPSLRSRGSAATALQKAKEYITANDSKRKRATFEIADSEDDELLDDSPNDRRTRHDEEVARQLQEELYREADILSSELDDAESEDERSDELDSPSASGGRGKGKAVARPRPRMTRSAVKHDIPDSDEAEESSDSVEYDPPSKRQKRAEQTKTKGSAKGKGKMPAAESDSDDMPRKSLCTGS